jgi:hypothetical protein
MSNNILIGYSPNDFFYTQAGSAMPNARDCSNLDIYNASWDLTCNNANFFDNSANCINMQLCRNKEKAEFLIENENSHTDAQKRSSDMKIVYDRNVMNSVNLGIGILFVAFLIYRNIRK